MDPFCVGTALPCICHFNEFKLVTNVDGDLSGSLRSDDLEADRLGE